MLAGILEIQIASDVARVRSDMAQINSIVGNSMAQVERAAGIAKAALGALGSVGLAAAFAHSIKGAIDLADNLNKLSQRTGVATDMLSQLQFAAKLSDVSADDLTTGLKKLNLSMAEGLGGDRAKIEAFKNLGISLRDASGRAKTADQMMLDIADSFAHATDGATKTAYAVALFGKAGDQMVPMLNGGSAAIKELMDKADKLGLTISKDFAKQAEEFNDNLTIIKASSDRLAISLGGDLVSAIGKATKAAADAAPGGKLHSLRVFIDEIGEQLLGWTSNAQKKGIDSLEADIRHLTAVLNAPVSDMFGQMDKTRAELQQKLNDLAALKAQYFNLNSAAGAGRGALPDPRSLGDPGSIAQQTATMLKPLATGASAAASEYDKLIKRIQEHIALAQAEKEKQRELTDEEKFAIKAQADFNELKKKYPGLSDALVKSMLKESAGLDEENKQRKVQIKLLQEAMKFKDEQDADLAAFDRARTDERDRVNASLLEQKHALEDSNVMLQAELGLLGATGKERDTALGQLRIQLELTRQIAQIEQNLKLSPEARAAAIDAAKANAEMASQQVAANAALREQVDLMNDLDRAGHDVFTALFDSGSSAFKRLGQILKTSLIDLLYQMTVKKWIFQIFGNVTGGAGAGGLAGAAVQSVGGSALTSLGGAAAGGLFGSIGTAFTAGSTSVGVMAGSIAGGGGLMGGIASAMGAIPVAGWVGLAALALYSIFGGKGGAPKVESAFGPNINDADRRGDPAQAKSAVDVLNASYAELAKQLGLLNANLDASVFIATDPKGTAQTQLEVASATANYARSARLGGIENVGRSDEELKAALAEETTRLMFAALKQSNLSDLYKSWLDAVGDQAGVADIQAAIDHVAKAATEKQALEAQLFDLTATDAEKLAKAREAERAAVDESNRALLEQVYAQQDLKAAAQSATNALQQETANLQIQLMRAQGNTAGADAAQRTLDIAGLSAADVAIYDYNATIRAQIAAVNAVTAVANQRASLETQIMQLTGDTAGLRAQELAAMDASLRPLQERIYALQDEQAAAAKAQAAAAAAKARRDAIASERNGLLQQLYQLHGNEAALRAMQLASLDRSNRALQQQIFALQDQQKAAEELKATWSGVTDSITDEVKRLRGLLNDGGANSFAQAQTALSIAMAQARAGDVNAAKSLPGLSQTVSGLALANSSSLLDYQRFISTQANSLEATGAAISSSLQIDVQPVVTEIQASRKEAHADSKKLADTLSTMNDRLDRLDTWFGQWDNTGMPPERAEL